MPSLRTRRRIRIAILLALLVAGVLAFGVMRRRVRPVHFDAPPPVPSLTGISLPFQPPEDLHYVFGWNNVPAAVLRMTTTRDADGGEVVVDYEARSLPQIQALWRFEASGRTVLDGRTLRPLRSTFRKRSGDKETTYETSYDWTAGVADVTVRKLRKGRTKEKTVSLPIGLDIPGAFLALRAAGAGQSVRVVLGDGAYQVVIADRGRGQVELSGSPVEALHYEVGVRKLESADEEESTHGAGFSSAQLWLTPDTHAPLRMEVQAVVGAIYAELVPPTEPPEAGG